MERLQLHSSYHQLSTVQSICLPGDTGNTGDTTSNCDTAVGGVGAVMNHVAVANSQLCSTHTHTQTHTYAHTCMGIYTTAPCTRSTKADQLTVDLARRAHQSPGRLVDADGLRGLPLPQRTGQGQSGVVAFLVRELVRLQEPLHRRRRENGLRLARQARHWSLRHSV